MESASRHRNPICSHTLGTTPDKVLTVDTLHAVYLGTMQLLCKEVMWLLSMAGKFGVRATMVEQITSACLSIRAHLKSFYRARHRANKKKKLTEIHAFNRKKVGDAANQYIKCKGART